MNAPELVRLIEINAYRCYVATLCAGPQSIQDLGKELREPQIGDLVMEVSTVWREDRGLTGVGRLLRKERKPTHTPEQWKEAGAEPGEAIPTELVWVIALVFDDSREFTWRNADFIKVSDKMRGLS